MQFDVLMFGEMRERKMTNGTCIASVARWPFGREEELGVWCLVPGIWYLVPGTWYLVPGTWYLVLGTWDLVLGTWHLVLGT